MEAVINFVGRCFAHAVYVTLGRVEKLSNLYLLNFDWRKIRVDEKVVKEMERLRSVPYPFSLNFLFNVSAKIKIAYLNAQSLNKHIADVQSDRTLMNANIFVCAETRLVKHDQCTVSGYNVFPSDDFMG